MDLQYPIGPFAWPADVSADQRRRYIDEIEQAPAHLRTAVAGLTGDQLDTPYRTGGWTVRQVAHHVPDSHLNSYLRFKLALTEDEPTIKPYDQSRWAELGDVRMAPVETSLVLLESLHHRWCRCCVRFPMPILRARFVIPRSASCGWTKTLRSMPGMGGTTWPTLRHCANAWPGNSGNIESRHPFDL